jgi:hypothetical protein
MSRRTSHSQLVAGQRRAALGVVVDALDAILEDGIDHPDWQGVDSALRTLALETAFAEADAVVSRLRDTGIVPAPITRADADQLIASAAAICVWGRTPGEPHAVLDHLAAAVALVPGTELPLAQLA